MSETQNLPAVIDPPGGPAVVTSLDDKALETVLVDGDLRKLTPGQRSAYYQNLCRSLGLNPMTRPFAYIVLNDKLTLYALKGATDQLRQVHRVSVEIVSREIDHALGVYRVTARATTPDGRSDEDSGSVAIYKAEYNRETKKTEQTVTTGESAANAQMRAETKAKRRVTLSICGLGWMDESELDTVRGYKKVATEEVEEAHVVTSNSIIGEGDYETLMSLAKSINITPRQLAVRAGLDHTDGLKKLSISDFNKVFADLKKIESAKKSTAPA